MPTSEDGGECGFVFDVDAWEAKTGRESSLSAEDHDSDGVWRCPHPSHNDQDRCLFHLPPSETDASVVRDALMEQLERPGREAKQFIGAQFGPIDLAHTIVECEDNQPIDLRHATFAGEANWTYAIVRQPLRLEGAVFEAEPKFVETRFENEVYLSKARFEAGARFIEARVREGAWCYKTAFGDVDFSMASFQGPVDFTEASFERCHFRTATFEDRADFTQATFEHAMLWGTRFSEAAVFDGATLPSRVNLSHATFEDTCSFADPTVLDGTPVVDLTDATIDGGALHQPDTDRVLYDLTAGTLGDISLAEESPPPDLFDHYRILNTTFDGFDFGQYRETLHATDWDLHTIAPHPELDTDAAPSPGVLEGTYLKAKNGANRIGDTRAAAEFFRKEMTYRRHQYRPRISDTDTNWRRRLQALWRWSANRLLDVTAGYGERPSRVVFTSITVVLTFTLLFWLTTPAPPYDTILGYLIISLESFITLVLGGAAEITHPGIRLLAEIEGFVGAFLIALFVFTLTRSIHR